MNSMKTIEDGRKFLNKTIDRIQQGDSQRALDGLFGGLLDLREQLPLDQWKRFSKETAIEHPLRELIHQDPMTRRSFDKPRGYAGDAVLLDFIYGISGPDQGQSVGADVYQFAAGRPAAEGVRRRRQLIAEKIDELQSDRDIPLSMLSIASGHLRELEQSAACKQGRIREFIALDSDPESCAHVSNQFPWIEVINSPFISLFRDEGMNQRFDFAYSAGLYDYLDERVGKKLTRRMFEMLAPGGTLLITNFLPTVVDAGYMETYMGWDLIYRDLPELESLANGIASESIESLNSSADSQRSIGYLEIKKKG